MLLKLDEARISVCNKYRHIYLQKEQISLETMFTDVIIAVQITWKGKSCTITFWKVIRNVQFVTKFVLHKVHLKVICRPIIWNHPLNIRWKENQVEIMIRTTSLIIKLNKTKTQRVFKESERSYSVFIIATYCLYQWTLNCMMPLSVCYVISITV